MAEFWLGPKAGARGYRLFGYDEIGSTSTEAVRAAAAGDVGDIWFAALRQTAGRGRRGRPWETASGNLAASLLVVPDCDPTLTATLGFVAGVALHRALDQLLASADAVTPHIALKWPNDVLTDDKKLAGILLEAQKRPDGRHAIVIGIGVNVVASPDGLPYPATSLTQLGIALSAEDVFGALSEHWVAVLDLWNSGRGIAAILAEWRRAAAGIGSEIAVSRDGETIRGIFESIDDSGRLIVRANDNSRIAITAGDVHLGMTASARI